MKPLRFKAFSLVGVPGFEPGASWTRTKRDTKLRHTPMQQGPLYGSFPGLSRLFSGLWYGDFSGLRRGDRSAGQGAACAAGVLWKTG